MPPVASAATGATAHNVINAIISQHLARCYVYFGRAGRARRIRAGWVRVRPVRALCARRRFRRTHADYAALLSAACCARFLLHTSANTSRPFTPRDDDGGPSPPAPAAPRRRAQRAVPGGPPRLGRRAAHVLAGAGPRGPGGVARDEGSERRLARRAARPGGAAPAPVAYAAAPAAAAECPLSPAAASVEGSGPVG